MSSIGLRRRESGAQAKLRCASVGAKTRSAGRGTSKRYERPLDMKIPSLLKRMVAGIGAAALMVSALVGCAPGQPYEQPTLTPTVSDTALVNPGTLTVGVNTENAPLAGQPSPSMRIVGIDVDVAAALADSLGLSLTVVDVGPDYETALSQKQVDMVMGVDKSDAYSFWTSEAYLSTGIALFAMDGNNTVPAADSTASFAAQSSSKSAWAISSEYDSATVVSTDDLPSAFSKLASGEVSYVAADAIIGSYAVHSAGINAHIVALMQQPSGFAAGCLDTNTELSSAISSAITTLVNNGVVSVIQTKWLGAPLNLASVPLTPTAAALAGTTQDTSTADAATDASADTTDAAASTEATADGTTEGDAATTDGTTDTTTDDTYVDPGYTDQTYTDPGYVDPGYVDQTYTDPGYVDPGYVDPGTTDTGYVDNTAAAPVYDEYGNLIS